MVQEGVNGFTRVTYKITLVDGVETNREETNREVFDPIDEIIENGTFEEESED